MKELSIKDFELSVRHVEGSANGKPVAFEMKTNSLKASIWRKPVSLQFDPDHVKDIQVFLAGLNNQVSWIDNNKSQIENRIIEDLLGIKNSAWLEENASPLTQDEFVEKISLTDIVFYSDGHAEMYLDDGDTFWGHVILVRLNHDQIDEICIGG